MLKINFVGIIFYTLCNHITEIYGGDIYLLSVYINVERRFIPICILGTDVTTLFCMIILTYTNSKNI